MTKKQTAGRDNLGDLAPKFAELNDDVLFGEVWSCEEELSPRDRSGGGQMLICVSGRGWYQEWGQEARELHPGDVVNIPTGVKHWHGAAKDSWFQHLAVEVLGEDGRTEWCEAVDDAQYETLK